MDLAKNGDPLIDGSGNVVEPTGTSQVDAFDVVEKRKVMPLFASLSATKTVNIDNLPEPDNSQQTVICAIVGMRLLGMSDVDIAEVTSSSLEQIQRIVKMPATQVTFEKMYQNMISAQSESTQGRIAAHSNRAVDVVLEMMEDTEVRDDVRLKAAQDVLDRSGTHPDQFFGETAQNNQSDDELRIVIMDESGENERVKVDIKKGS